MKHFRLHGNCIIVKGASKALIYDLFKFRTIGLSLKIVQLYEADILSSPFEVVLEKYPEFKDQIVTLVEDLIEKDFGFFTREPDSFPALNTVYKPKRRLYSSVIEIDTSSLNSYEKLVQDLVSLDCVVFYLIVRNEVANLEAFEQFLKFFARSRATWVQVILEKPFLTYDQMKQVTHDMRVTYNVFNAPTEELIEGRWWFEESEFKFPIVQYQTKTFELDAKTEYSADSFRPTQTVFIESQEHNPFFHLKVCISKEGYYKNDLSFEKSFGNFHTTTIAQLLQDNAFKKMWYMSNNKIEKCKDCQHRYQCESNSDVKEEDGKFYKVNTCHFDPYENIWQAS